jgi:ribose transport system permease protein
MTSKDTRDDGALASDESSAQTPRSKQIAESAPSATSPDIAAQTVSAGAPPASAADRGRNALSRLWVNRTYRTVLGVYIFLIILILLSKTVSSSFGSPGFVRTVVGLSAFTAVAAFGQFIVVLTGGLDLSIPNVMTSASVLLTGLTLGENSKVWWVLPFVLLFGVVVGVINGLGIVYLRLSPVVMTLAVNVILSGAVLVYTNGTPKGRAPPFVVDLIQGKALGTWLPNIILFLIIFLILGTILANQTVFGRYVYAVGSNRQVAYLSGVRVHLVLVTVYGISGLCAALAGVMVAGYGNQSYLGLGDPYLVLTLAAVVVGGVNILGGRGLYIGVVGGAIILTTISTTLSGTSLPDAVKQMVYAVAIIAAVLAARQQQSV